MRFRLLPAAAAVAMLIAACGGSSTPTTTAKKASSHKATVTHTQTQANANTTASTNTSNASSTTTVSSSSKPTFASVSHCTDLSGVGSQFAKAMAAATSGGHYNLDAAVKAYQDLANAAPSAIRSDVQTIATAFTAYASALSKAGYKVGTVPSAAQIAQLEQAAKVFSESKIATAAKNIEAWAVQNCTGA